MPRHHAWVSICYLAIICLFYGYFNISIIVAKFNQKSNFRMTICGFYPTTWLESNWKIYVELSLLKGVSKNINMFFPVEFQWMNWYILIYFIRMSFSNEWLIFVYVIKPLFLSTFWVILMIRWKSGGRSLCSLH